MQHLAFGAVDALLSASMLLFVVALGWSLAFATGLVAIPFAVVTSEAFATLFVAELAIDYLTEEHL
jgi:hypothetical protein